MSQPSEQRRWNVRSLVVATVLAVGLAALSVLYQRPGSETVQWQTECSVEHSFHCYRPIVAGGFPFASWFDNPASSVQNTLGPEDEFLWVSFLVDVWFYSFALVLTFGIWRRRG